MKRCLVCNDPSDSPFCPTCADLDYAGVIRDYGKNKLCNREACRYYPAGAAAATRSHAPLTVIEEVA